MVMLKKNKNKKVISIIVSVVLVLALIVSGVITYKYSNRQKITATKSEDKIQQSGGSKIDLSPPTTEEKQASEANKDHIVQQAESSQPATTSSVKPAITYAGQYNNQVEVGAYVSGVLESDGVCITTLSKDSEKITKQVVAVQNINSMDCPVAIIARSEIPSAGAWAATVQYKSAKYNGTSDQREVGVK